MKSATTLLVACALLLTACTGSPLAFDQAGTPSPAFTASGIWTRGELVDLFVHVREAERRRAPEEACQALHFQNRGDRQFYLEELYYLAGVPSGPICAASEIHLVGAPVDGGAGDYLFLEPVRGRYPATFLTIVDVGGRPRVLYRRPEVTEKERAKLRPADLQATALQRRAAYWQGLRGRALEQESDRLKRMLQYQGDAQTYAAQHELDLQPFAPDPRMLQARLAPLPPEALRQEVLRMLSGRCG